MTKAGNVYFMRRADNVGPVKIGCSAQPLDRLDQMQAWSPEPLTIVTSAPASFRTEQRLHRQFDHLRLHGEWFEAAQPLLALISRVAATGKIPPAPSNDRSQRMARMYQDGQTLQQIGDQFNITRERVRQILRKQDVPSEGHRAYSVAAKAEKAVLRLTREGYTIPQIAKAVGDCQMNVRQVLKRAGVKAVRAKRQPEPETLIKAREVAVDYKAGMLGSDIAEKHNIPQPHIYRLLRLVNVDVSRKSAVPKLPVEEAAKRYLNGETIKGLSRQYGITAVTIRRAFKRHGVTLRGKAENEVIRQDLVREAKARKAAA